MLTASDKDWTDVVLSYGLDGRLGLNQRLPSQDALPCSLSGIHSAVPIFNTDGDKGWPETPLSQPWGRTTSLLSELYQCTLGLHSLSCQASVRSTSLAVTRQFTVVVTAAFDRTSAMAGGTCRHRLPVPPGHLASEGDGLDLLHPVIGAGFAGSDLGDQVKDLV